MKKFAFILILGTVMLFMTSAYADVPEIHRVTQYQGVEPLFSVDITEEWNVQLKDGYITGVSDDGMLWFFLGELEEKTFDSATEEIKDDMEEILTDIIVTRTTVEFNLNGMVATSFEGTAKENGKNVIFFTVLFKLETDEIGVLMFIADPAAEQLHLNDIMNMALSISRR